MKKSFYEFMDNYEPNNFAEQNDISVESVKRRVMDKITIDKRRRKYKLTSKTFATVAAVCITAVTGIVVTAYEIGVFDKAVNFFSNNISSESLQLLNENDYETIRNNLKTEHIVTESEGATVELTGSMHDENVVYLFCTMTLPEGTVLPDDFIELLFDVQSTDYYSLGDKEYNEYKLNMSYSSLTVNFADYNMPGSNTVDFTCIVNLSGDWQTDSLSGFLIEDLVNISDKTVSSTGEIRFKKSMIQKGKWLVPIKSEAEIKSTELLNKPVSVDIPIDKSDNIDYHKMTIESAKISPLSLEIIGKNLNMENTSFFSDIIKNDLSIVMKDGMEETRFNRDLIDCGISKDYYYEMLVFETPIDVSKIDYIKIGDAEIKVN